jgi:hypothetical protein
MRNTAAAAGGSRNDISRISPLGKKIAHLSPEKEPRLYKIQVAENHERDRYGLDLYRSGQFDGALHAGMSGLEGDFGVQALQLFLQPNNALFHGANGTDPFGDQKNLVGLERLGDVIEGAAANRFNRRVDGGVGRDDHDLEPWRGREEKGAQIHPALGSQPEVDECQVKRLQCRFRLSILGGADRRHAVAACLQAHRQRLANVRFIVDHQNVQRGCSHSLAGR